MSLLFLSNFSLLFAGRIFDPQLARWMEVDPADEFHSPYVYCGNNPVNFVDPDGKQTYDTFFTKATHSGGEIIYNYNQNLACVSKYEFSMKSLNALYEAEASLVFCNLNYLGGREKENLTANIVTYTKTSYAVGNSIVRGAAIHIAAEYLEGYTVGKVVKLFDLQNEIADEVLEKFGAESPLDDVIEYILDNTIPDTIDNVRAEYNEAAGVLDE
jgi:hypothetical protein